LWYAQQLGATHLVDVATLTGACVVALGRAASGLFGQPEPFAESSAAPPIAPETAAGRCRCSTTIASRSRARSPTWSTSAAVRPASCTAAMFIREFVGDLPWVHLDIAGTAWADEAKPGMPKGATGVAVRTLAELAFTSAEWS
jgi:leucyl aminopeptidase